VSAPEAPGRRGMRRRVVVSSFLGSTIEWFDFYIYGLAASLYFAKEFFPDVDPVVGVLASFGTLAGGFVVRPLGGLIGGHFGDRYGRKRVLVVSMVLMGTSTFVVGLLPGYATIGVWAPVVLVLLRVIQGLGAGAEWGGGVLMVVEHFAARRRGFWGSIGALGVYTGITLSTVLFLLLSLAPAGTQGLIWRIPFLASGVLIVVALWIRLRIAESPQAPTARDRARLPVARLFRRSWRRVVVGVLIAIAPAVSYQVYVTFGNSYGKLVGFSITTLLALQLVASILAMVLSPAFGALSDRVGRKPVIVAGCVVLCPSAFVFFGALNSGSVVAAMASLVLLEVGHSMIYGPQPALLAEIYPADVRYSGASTAYQCAGALSGLAPLWSAVLLASSGGPPHVTLVPVALVVTCVLTVIGLVLVPETAKRPLPGAEEPIGRDAAAGHAAVAT
jgi:MFS transporter, MHS family, shikimate and dehydroshikimate transport protein